MLLALAGVSRGHEIQYLDIRYMSKTDNSYTFQFSTLTKSWRNGKSPPSITFQSYDKDPLLCPIRTLETYLKRSEPWRQEEKFQLLLSFNNPHGEVKACSLARWIKFVLREAGIDTQRFIRHIPLEGLLRQRSTIG